jgi:hypothetical protein
LGRFPDLKKLTLGGGTSTYSQSFVDALHKLPLQTLVLKVGELVSLASLTALVSSSTKHLTLLTLTLNFLEWSGKIGTRIAQVDLPFDTVDLETEYVTDDLMTDDWQFPVFPPGFSVEGLLALRQGGQVNGVEADGKVFEAIEVLEAYEEDVNLLGEMWDEWKDEEKKSRKEKRTKGKKGKKAKK